MIHTVTSIVQYRECFSLPIIDYTTTGSKIQLKHTADGKGRTLHLDIIFHLVQVRNVSHGRESQAVSLLGAAFILAIIRLPKLLELGFRENDRFDYVSRSAVSVSFTSVIITIGIMNVGSIDKKAKNDKVFLNNLENPAKKQYDKYISGQARLWAALLPQ